MRFIRLLNTIFCIGEFMPLFILTIENGFFDRPNPR